MNKIAVDTVKAMLKEAETADTMTKTFQLGESEVVVEIKTRLKTAEKSTFIRRVLSGCFDSAGDFRPEYFTPMVRATVIQMCTNLPAISIRGSRSDDGESLMDIDAMERLFLILDMDNLDSLEYRQMIAELVQLTNNAIDWKRQRSGSDIICDAIQDGRERINALIDEVEQVLNLDRLDELITYAATLSKKTEELGEGELVKAILQAQSGDAK